jgi:O-antigen ligase
VPALIVLAALVLMPFGRAVEAPFLLLAVLGATVALSGRLRGTGPELRLILALFAAFSIPMLLSLPDAVNGEKSLLTTIGALRFLCFSLGLIFLLQRGAEPARTRDRTLYLVGAGCSWLLLIWCADGLLQFVSGRDVLGFAMHRGYVNSLFGDDENLKFGITLALLLPVALVHVLRRWPAPWAAAFLALALLALTLTGKRGAWISVVVELAVLALYYWRRNRLGVHRALAICTVALLAVGLGYSYSDWVRGRSEVLVTAAQERDYEALNEATGYRLPIWSGAIAMARSHWINGVGPRGFRYAYADYAPADDERWTRRLSFGGARASHSHQLLLEIACETGVIGLVGLAAMVGLLLSAWRRAPDAARARALPFAASLCGLLFPVNTHPAWYSSWTGVFLWLLLALFVYALAEPRSADR